VCGTQLVRDGGHATLHIFSVDIDISVGVEQKAITYHYWYPCVDGNYVLLLRKLFLRAPRGSHEWRVSFR